MKELDYQDRVLKTLDNYLDALSAARTEADQIEKLKAANPTLSIPSLDHAEKAWGAMKDAGLLPPSRAEVPFSARHDGCGRPVPNVTLKVPTGGGKTYLAVNAVSRVMGRYLSRNAGFVLWVVPNEAIYSQTLKHLRNRDHPYRQILDRASANRTKVLEKGDRLHGQDVETHLCVMVLMLQAGNRENKETLRMFRDRGDVHGFFPPEGEQQAHAAMLAQIPNLDGYNDLYPMVKDSLGNALRSIRPVVVLDEGQKATSDLAYSTLYGFNPIFVLELTATPKDVKASEKRPARFANLLVEVTGIDVHREGMIKMPLNIDPRQSADWKATLNSAFDRLNELQRVATQHRGDTGRYIRPILLVQVERTGMDQRDSDHIHSDDVKEWLLSMGLDDAQIAIKTAEQNDLNQPENQDLLSDTNRVRVIITKAALQEGWDCPFAYVLCSLSANSSLSAMTQLVGRILRQPYATKTGIDALDECYVITHRAETKRVVEAIKKGLENDGLADLVMRVSGDGGGSSRRARPIKRRDDFKSLEIYLPQVMWTHGEVRELDYETDILARLDWRGFDPTELAKSIPDNAELAASQLQRIELADEGDRLVSGIFKAPTGEVFEFDPAYVSRAISDLVPNPFVAREIVGKALDILHSRGFDAEKLGRLESLVVEVLRRGLDAERTQRAEVLFRTDLEAGRIQFRLRLDGKNYAMPKESSTMEPEGSRKFLLGDDGNAVRKSLFHPMYALDLNGDEQNVAIMLDGNAAITWWHRNVAKNQYGLQGWKRGRIYPDFIFAVAPGGGTRRLVALETKGEHLQNPDTDYKRAFLDLISDHFSWDTTLEAGELDLTAGGETVVCKLVLMRDIPTELPKLVSIG